MRIFAFVLLALVFGCSKEYYKNRSYSCSNCIPSIELKFNADSTFIYSERDCISSCSLSGKYIIKEKNIYFSYQLPETSFSGDLIHHTSTTSDSCQFRFQLMEMEGNSMQPLPVTVLLLTNTDSSFRNYCVADMDGKASIHVPQNAFPLTISFNNIGYTRRTILVADPVVTNDTIFLQRNGGWYSYLSLPSDSCSYRIKKMNARKLDLCQDSTCSKADSAVVKHILLNRVNGLRAI